MPCSLTTLTPGFEAGYWFKMLAFGSSIFVNRKGRHPCLPKEYLVRNLNPHPGQYLVTFPISFVSSSPE